MFTLKIIPTDDSRRSPEFFKFRQELSRVTLLETDTNHTPVEARIAFDDMCEAWLEYRNASAPPPSIDEI